MPASLFVAVDTPNVAAASELATTLKPLDGLGLKLGLEFFGACGSEVRGYYCSLRHNQSSFPIPR